MAMNRRSSEKVCHTVFQVAFSEEFRAKFDGFWAENLPHWDTDGVHIDLHTDMVIHKNPPLVGVLFSLWGKKGDQSSTEKQNFINLSTSELKRVHVDLRYGTIFRGWVPEREKC